MILKNAEASADIIKEESVGMRTAAGGFSIDRE